MPSRKTDTNNRWAVSLNNIGANYDYPEGNYDRRAEIVADHELYQRGLMYVLANHPRVPDEFAARSPNGVWPGTSLWTPTTGRRRFMSGRLEG